MKYVWVLFALITMWPASYLCSLVASDTIWIIFPLVFTFSAIILFFIKKALEYQW